MSDFESRLKALRDAYAEKLPAKIAEVESLCERFTQVGEDPEFENLLRLLHGLTGSGKTFGFSELGEAASRLETFLKEAAGEGAALDAEKLRSLLTDLRQAAGMPPA